MFLNTKKCPNCGTKLPQDARFCASCGSPVGSGIIRCSSCNTENLSDAIYCKKCGQPLSQTSTPQVYSHRWTRGANEFAVRVEADDLQGLLKRDIKVEPGTNAMFIYQGTSRGILPPGEYTLGTLGQRVKDWFTGDIPERATILLVEVVPTELVFRLDTSYTKDDLPIGISIRLQAEVTEPGKFLVNLLKGRERFTQDDLHAYLFPEVAQVADTWLRQHTLQQLTEDLELRLRLELALDERLRMTFSQTGLRFLHVRTAELNLEPFDHIKGIRSQYKLKVAEVNVNAAGEQEMFDAETHNRISKAEAEAKAKARFTEIQKQVDLQALAEETTKVELEERKSELYQRMRQAVLSDKMNEVRSEKEFDRFLDEQDFDKLLRVKEREDLKKTWADQAEDHDKARAHLLAKLDIEYNYELQMAGLKLQQDFSQAKLDMELELARKKADYEFDMRRKNTDEGLRLEQERQRIQDERRKKELEISELQQRIELATEREQDMLDLEVLAKNKEIHRLDDEESLRIKREHELAMRREEQKLELDRWVADERRLQAEREHEMKLRTLELEGEIKKVEIYKGMTGEQILAADAAKSDSAAHALEEKYKSSTNEQVTKQTKEIYEQRLSDKEEAARKQEEKDRQHQQDLMAMHEHDIDNLKGISERALDRMSDTTQAIARGGGGSQPIIVVPGAGGPQVIQPGQGGYTGQPAPAGKKVCPNCGQFVDADARHCTHCGIKFEGVG